VKIFQQFCGAVAAWLLCRLRNLHAKRSRNKTSKKAKNNKLRIIKNGKEMRVANKQHET